MTANVNSTENEKEEKPPFLSSWKKIYSIVFINLVLLIVLFYLFTKYFE